MSDDDDDDDDAASKLQVKPNGDDDPWKRVSGHYIEIGHRPTSNPTTTMTTRVPGFLDASTHLYKRVCPSVRHAFIKKVENG